MTKPIVKKYILINKKRFLWGNIKPDCASKYKFTRHYYDESIGVTLNLINELSSLTVSEVYYDYGKKSLARNLELFAIFFM